MSHRLKKILGGSILALLAVYVVGCSKSGTSPAGTAKFQINMIDGPGTFSAVNIVIDSIQAHIASSDSTSGWVTLNSAAGTYDLLQLVNGNSAMVANTSVPAGRYSQIRLFLGSGSNIVVAGASFPLVIPSGLQSGLKLNVDASVQSGTTYSMTLDFNVNSSIVVTGNPLNGQYILKPVIRVIVGPSNGVIDGSVLPHSALPTITAFNSSDTVTTVADTSGDFKVTHLSTGSYDVDIVPSDTTLNDTTLTNVNVTAGQTTNVGTIILSTKNRAR